MSGFSVGDVFGKTFLSAETIILGKQVKKAEISGFTNQTSNTTTFKQALTGTAGGYSISHSFRKEGSSSEYSGTPSFSKWDNDDTLSVDNYGFNIKGSSNTETIVRLTLPSGKVWGGSGHVNVCLWSGNTCSTSLGSAANSSSYPQIKKVGSNYNAVDIVLKSASDYISIDPRGKVSGIGNMTIQVGGKKFKTKTDGESDSLVKKSATPIKVTLIKWIKYVNGCTDNQATNYNPQANQSTSCSYVVAPITKFTTSVSESKQGESKTTTFDWALDTGTTSAPKRATSVKLFVSNTAGSDQLIKEWGSGFETVEPFPYNLANLPVGDSTFKLVSYWDMNTGSKPSKTVKIKIVAADSLLTCQDPNASKYGKTSATGDCGSCNSGYARDSGTCKKQGCMTQDDYSYDSTAEIHVESMCSGTPETGGGNGDDGNGATDGDNGGGATDGGGTEPQIISVLPDTDEDITTTGDDISAQIEPETPGLGRFVLPGIGVAALLVILMR